MSSDISSTNFREIFKNDGFNYVLISKSTEPIDINFPNMPSWYKDEWESWVRDSLPNVDVICFEYKGSNYKVVRNASECINNEGNFGALFDSNNDKILDIVSSGDCETTIQSLKIDDVTISDDLLQQVSPYLRYIEVFLHNHTEFEYVVFKVLVESKCLYDIDWIDERPMWRRNGEEAEDRESE